MTNDNFFYDEANVEKFIQAISKTVPPDNGDFTSLRTDLIQMLLKENGEITETLKLETDLLDLQTELLSVERSIVVSEFQYTL